MCWYCGRQESGNYGISMHLLQELTSSRNVPFSTRKKAIRYTDEARSDRQPLQADEKSQSHIVVTHILAGDQDIPCSVVSSLINAAAAAAGTRLDRGLIFLAEEWKSMLPECSACRSSDSATERRPRDSKDRSHPRTCWLSALCIPVRGE